MRRGVIVVVVLLAASCGGAKKQPATGGGGAGGDGKGTPAIAGCKQHPDGPDQATCEALVEKLLRVMPDDMSPDRQQDVCDCMGMPKELITCLTDVETREDADRCVDAYTNPSRPTRAACVRAVARLKELDPGIAADTDEELITACLEQASTGELECIEASTTLEEVEKCGS